jgi:hypothetical protein
MQRKTRTRLNLVALVSALVVTVMTAVPLYDAETDASLLTLIAGSMGFGVLLANVVREMRSGGRGGDG